MRNPRLSLASSIFAASIFAALASCGDNHEAPDGPPPPDAPPDAPIPDAPELGVQLDRMGRPVIGTALVGSFRDPDDVAIMKKTAYGELSDPAMWATAPVATGRSVAAELATNLAILDVLDKGNAAIPGTGPNAPGCKNQVLYNGTPAGGGTPSATSYDTLARVLADDMLYVDTSKATCTSFLSLEIEASTGGVVLHTQCGGRTPTHDVIDHLYSLLIAGLNGFTLPPALQPRITDNVGAHADVSDTAFPYFGPPH